MRYGFIPEYPGFFETGLPEHYPMPTNEQIVKAVRNCLTKDSIVLEQAAFVSPGEMREFGIPIRERGWMPRGKVLFCTTRFADAVDKAFE